MTKDDIIMAMGTEKPVWIQMRVSEPLKAVLQAHADNEHMSLTGFLLFTAAQYSPEIGEAVLRDGARNNKATTSLADAIGEKDE